MVHKKAPEASLENKKMQNFDGLTPQVTGQATSEVPEFKILALFRISYD